MFGYVVPAADEVLLISGGKAKEGDHPFRIERGSKFLGFSFRRKYSRLSLAQRMASVEEPCITQQGITVNLKAKVYFKVPRTDESIYAAGERFRGDSAADMQTQVGQVFSVHLRSIVGSMTVEEIIRDRQKLADNVREASKTEVGDMGLSVDSFGISHMDDGNSGYIAALRAPFEAEAQKNAAVAQSQANQVAAEAEQLSQRAQADATKQTLIAKAKFQAEVDTQRAVQEQAGPLAQAQSQSAVLEEQEKIAMRNATLRKAQLESEVIAPANAMAQKAKIDAEAQGSVAKINAEAQAQVVEVQAQARANNTRVEGQANAEARVLMADAEAHALSANSEALAANDQVNVTRMIIEALPQIVESAAHTLDGVAQVTVLNGAEGVNDLVANSISQGMAIFNTVRQQVTGIGSGLNATEQDMTDMAHAKV